MLGCADWQTAIDRAWMLNRAALPAPLLHAAALKSEPISTLLEGST